MDGNESLGSFAGATGVGALCVLGSFFFLEGRDPSLLSTLETYAKTATWGVVAAIPALAVAYVIGVAVVTVAAAALRRIYGPRFSVEVDDLVRLSAVVPSETLLSKTYLQMRQERDILGGAAIGFIALAGGALTDIANAPELRTAIIIAAVGTFSTAVLVFRVAGVRGKQAHLLASNIRTTSDAKARVRLAADRHNGGRG